MRDKGWFFLLILIVSFLILFGRLFELQIIKGGYFSKLSSENRIRRIPIRAPRGEILDRNGLPFAKNLPVYKLVEFGKRGEPISYRDITQDQKEKVSKEETIVSENKRDYPLGEAAAHILGYVGEVGVGEVGGAPADCPRARPYILGDFAGRGGVEQEFECLLRGENGEELVEVDTSGQKVRSLGKREPRPGETVKLSIDSGLHKIAQTALGGKTAGLVAQDPKTGEILSLVSSPSFDPNKIAQEFLLFEKDKRLPLFNRAIGGAYQPGSTFKIVTAAAGLEEGKIDENFTFEDPGVIKVGRFSYANWYFTQYGRTEGRIDLVRAIKRSTDTFFYKVGEIVGVRRLADWARAFGLGRPTGVDLPGEVDGLIPTPEWKEKVQGERWFLGNTYHLSIGQGDIHLTPLQVNVMTSVLASSGKLCKPTVLFKKDQKCSDIGLSQKSIQLITNGMIEACRPGGTAFPLFDFEPQVACKTGTAEFGDPAGRTHAWLTAFAPADSPEIVITVLVEGGGEGSSVAAPIVREVLDYWFHQR